MSRVLQLAYRRIYCFILFAPLCVNSQVPVFYHYTVDKGLPQNSINCILQDRQGFMWFGTQDGLARFDGYKFKVFRHDPKKNSISNNYIWNIYEDRERIFWITTFGGGLNRFDPASETFKHFKREKENTSTLSSNNTFVTEEVNGQLWIGTNDGLARLDKKTGKIKNYLQTQGNQKDIGNFIGTVSAQRSGYLWFNSDAGLTRLHLQTEKIEFFGQKIFNCPFSIQRISRVKSLDDKLLITCDTGLVELDLTRQTGQVVLNSSDVRSERKVTFNGVLVSPNGKYWISTNQGLVIFDRNSGQFTFHQHSASVSSSLTHNSVLSVFRSSSGVYWVGTRNGLNKLEREQNDFFLLRSIPGQQNTLSHKNVSSIAGDKNGLIWIGTSEGLNAFDRYTKNIKVFKPDSVKKNSSLSSGYILSLLKDGDSVLWIGTRGGGLNKLVVEKNILSAKIRQFRLDNKNIQHISKGDSNILWLGSNGGGLIRFNKHTGETEEYPARQDGTGPSHPFVYYVFTDSYKNIWLGTPTGGLNLFDPARRRFIYIKNEPANFHSLSNNIVLTIFEDKDHRLWVGTSGGLNRLALPLQAGMFTYFEKNVDPEKDSLFVRYGIADGLPNDVIYGIIQDDNGSFWLTTNNGLVKFVLSGNRHEIKTYDVRDGIQNNEFNQNTYYKNTRGELYFGGVDGFNIFHPDSLKKNEAIPPVVITDFKLYNESIVPGDQKRYGFSMNRSIGYTNEIRLAYHHDVISFEFAALNYINTEKNRYQYMLEGFDKNWVDAGENRFASFTNLAAGKYTFRVRASNNDGVWNEKGISVRLIVPSPPWLSWYAWLGYFIIISSVIYYFIRRRITATRKKYETQVAIEKAKADERDRFRKKSARDFHDEAGNRITKINLFTELAGKEAGSNAGVKNYLEKIHQNISELSAGMRDFIWTMDPAKDTVTETIIRLKEFGDSMFTDSGVDFILTGLHPGFDRIQLPMDVRRAILQIFKEAMNNCIKHAGPSVVRFSANMDRGILEIKLQDNGKGFDPGDESSSKGYGLGIMKERGEKAGAIFSIVSQPAKGTEVVFRYNIPHMGN